MLLLNSPSSRYLLRRISQASLVLLIVVVLQFFLLQLAPGDVADVIAGEAQASDPEFVKRLRLELGLDRPLWIQLGLHLQRVVTLDLGQAHSFDAPVLDLILQCLPATLLLMVASIAMAWVLGAALGIWAALHARGPTDTLVTFAALLFYATPGFLVGIGMILLFTVKLKWFPMSGMTALYSDSTWWAQALDIARHLFMPMVSLSLFLCGHVHPPHARLDVGGHAPGLRANRAQQRSVADAYRLEPYGAQCHAAHGHNAGAAGQFLARRVGRH